MYVTKQAEHKVDAGKSFKSVLLIGIAFMLQVATFPT